MPCCSGTLSYLFNNFVGTRSFSEVVAEAKQAGFTEPDPRDDLSGTDVARKVRIFFLSSNLVNAPCVRPFIWFWTFSYLLLLQVTILARESGLRLDLDGLPVQNLVPKPLQVSLYNHSTNFIINKDNTFDTSVFYCNVHLRLVHQQKSSWRSYLSLMTNCPNKDKRLKQQEK